MFAFFRSLRLERKASSRGDCRDSAASQATHSRPILAPGSSKRSSGSTSCRRGIPVANRSWNWSWEVDQFEQLRSRVTIEGPPEEIFASGLVRCLYQYDRSNPRFTVVNLLEFMKRGVGEDQQSRLSDLIAEYTAYRKATLGISSPTRGWDSGHSCRMLTFLSASSGS